MDRSFWKDIEEEINDIQKYWSSQRGGACGAWLSSEMAESTREGAGGYGDIIIANYYNYNCKTWIEKSSGYIEKIKWVISRIRNFKSKISEVFRSI